MEVEVEVLEMEVVEDLVGAEMEGVADLVVADMVAMEDMVAVEMVGMEDMVVVDTVGMEDMVVVDTVGVEDLEAEAEAAAAVLVEENSLCQLKRLNLMLTNSDRMSICLIVTV